jgi:hypothetical protein
MHQVSILLTACSKVFLNSILQVAESTPSRFMPFRIKGKTVVFNEKELALPQQAILP